LQAVNIIAKQKKEVIWRGWPQQQQQQQHTMPCHPSSQLAHAAGSSAAGMQCAADNTIDQLRAERAQRIMDVERKQQYLQVGCARSGMPRDLYIGVTLEVFSSIPTKILWTSQELVDQHGALQMLLQRNPKLQAGNGTALQLPFIIIQVGHLAHGTHHCCCLLGQLPDLGRGAVNRGQCGP
jgi:hypothetical protein